MGGKASSRLPRNAFGAGFVVIFFGPAIVLCAASFCSLLWVCFLSPPLATRYLFLCTITTCWSGAAITRQRCAFTPRRIVGGGLPLHD
jgi:hypothetical protein